MIDTLNLTTYKQRDYILHVMAHTCVNISMDGLTVAGWKILTHRPIQLQVVPNQDVVKILRRRHATDSLSSKSCLPQL